MHLSLMFYHHPVPPPPRRNPGFSPKCFCLLATFAAGAHRNIINIQWREWPALLKLMSEYRPNIDAQSHTAYKYGEHSCGTNITHKQKQKQAQVKNFFDFFSAQKWHRKYCSRIPGTLTISETLDVAGIESCALLWQLKITQVHRSVSRQMHRSVSISCKDLCRCHNM